MKAGFGDSGGNASGKTGKIKKLKFAARLHTKVNVPADGPRNRAERRAAARRGLLRKGML